METKAAATKTQLVLAAAATAAAVAAAAEARGSRGASIRRDVGRRRLERRGLESVNENEWQVHAASLSCERQVSSRGRGLRVKFKFAPQLHQQRRPGKAAQLSLLSTRLHRAGFRAVDSFLASLARLGLWRTASEHGGPRSALVAQQLWRRPQVNDIFRARHCFAQTGAAFGGEQRAASADNQSARLASARRQDAGASNARSQVHSTCNCCRRAV